MWPCSVFTGQEREIDKERAFESLSNFNLLNTRSFFLIDGFIWQNSVLANVSFFIEYSAYKHTKPLATKKWQHLCLWRTCYVQGKKQNMPIIATPFSPAGWVTSTFYAQASSIIFSLWGWRGCVLIYARVLDEEGWARAKQKMKALLESLLRMREARMTVLPSLYLSPSSFLSPSVLCIYLNQRVQKITAD